MWICVGDSQWLLVILIIVYLFLFRCLCKTLMLKMHQQECVLLSWCEHDFIIYFSCEGFKTKYWCEESRFQTHFNVLRAIKLSSTYGRGSWVWVPVMGS